MAGPVFASEYVVQKGDSLWKLASKALGTDDPKTIINGIKSVVDANSKKYHHLLTDVENDGIQGDIIRHNPADILDLSSIELVVVSPLPEETATITEEAEVTIVLKEMEAKLAATNKRANEAEEQLQVSKDDAKELQNELDQARSEN